MNGRANRMGLQRFSIVQRMTVLVIVPVIAMVGLGTVITYDIIERFSDLRNTKSFVAVNLSLDRAAEYYEKALAGEMTMEEAKAAAEASILRVRYDGGEGYIAILDDDFMVAHPIHAELNGKNMYEWTAHGGRKVAQEAVALGHKEGVNYLSYPFKNPTTGELDTKTSAIARFEPWGWTLIAGVFGDRFDLAMGHVRMNIVNWTVGLGLVCFLLAFYLGRSISRPIGQLTATMTRVATDDLNAKVPYTDAPFEIGASARAVAVFRDNARQLVKVKDDLEQALRQEKEFSAQQRQFVSIVSHEFRTPLAIIDGAAGALERRRGRMEEHQIEEKLTMIRQSVMRLIRLMESTLTASKFEAGNIALEIVSFDLRKLLGQIMDERRAIASHARIDMEIDALPDRIEVDERLMYSVFDNLVSNAIKYGGQEPRVEIRAWVDRDQVAVAVRDHGVGIPPEELAKIGQRFFRASTSTGVPGTGVGLSFVRMVTELHGGGLSVESTVGEGSVFTVRLPIRQAVAETVAA